jgi:hypothetical protein
MLAVVDLNGSGAATLESFYVGLSTMESTKKWYENDTFSHLVQTMIY